MTNENQAGEGGDRDQTSPPKALRDNLGRFLPGCKAGPGRRKLPRHAEYQKAAEAAISPEDLNRLIRNALGRAMSGDASARTWIGKYYLNGSTRRVPPIKDTDPAFQLEESSG